MLVARTKVKTMSKINSKSRSNLSVLDGNRHRPRGWPITMSYSSIVQKFSSIFFFLLAALTTIGCATSHTIMQSAKTLEPKQVQLTTGVSMPLSTMMLGGMIDVAKQVGTEISEATQGEQSLTEDQLQDAMESALGLVLFAPSPSYEFMGKMGVAKHWDVGLRLATTQFGCEVKSQMIDTEDGLDGSFLLGYSHGFGLAATGAIEKIYDVFETIKMIEYKRHNFDVGFLLGKEWKSIFSLYGGPRYIFSYIKLEQNAAKAAELVDGLDEIPSVSKRNGMHQIGGVVGLMVGYKYVFLNVELTALWVGFKPTVFGREANLSGLSIQPSIGLTAKF